MWYAKVATVQPSRARLGCPSSIALTVPEKPPTVRWRR